MRAATAIAAVTAGLALGGCGNGAAAPHAPAGPTGVIAWTTANGSVRVATAAALRRRPADAAAPAGYALPARRDAPPGPGVVELAPGTRTARHEQPRVSPDERLVAYVTDARSQRSTVDVALVGRPGSGVAIVAGTWRYGITALAWLPDSRGLVLSDGLSIGIVRWAGSPRREAVTAIWRARLPLPDSQTTTIVALSASPDGRRVAFERWLGTRSEADVVDVAAPHRVVRLLAASSLGGIRFTHRGVLVGEARAVVRLPSGGGRPEVLARMPAETFAVDQLTGISLDERFLLVTRPCAHGCTTAFVADLRSGHVRALGRTTGLAISPSGGSVVTAEGCDSGIAGALAPPEVRADPLATPSAHGLATLLRLDADSSCDADWR